MSAPKPAIPAAGTATGIIFVRKIFKIRNSFWKEFEYQRSKLLKQKHEENIALRGGFPFLCSLLSQFMRLYCKPADAAVISLVL